MGCGSSKSTSVVAPMPLSEAARSPTKECQQDKMKTGDQTTTARIITVKAMAGSSDSILADSQYNSIESITKPVSSKTAPNSNEMRNGSAKSTDSGLGGDQASIITEKSSPTLKEVAEVPESEASPNLAISGKQMKTLGPPGHRKRSTLPPLHPDRGRNAIQKRLSMEEEKKEEKMKEKAKGKEEEEGEVEEEKEEVVRKEEEESSDCELEAILEKHVQSADVLINELPDTSSIVKRPVSRGGVAFDITTTTAIATTTTGQQRSHFRKPPCVVKYSQHKRASEVVTHAELDEKQRVADQRRKEHEQMRLERIRAQEEKDRQVAEALAKFATMQTGLKGDKIKREEKMTERANEDVQSVKSPGTAQKREKSSAVEKKLKAGSSKTAGSKKSAKVAMNRSRQNRVARKV